VERAAAHTSAAAANKYDTPAPSQQKFHHPTRNSQQPSTRQQKRCSQARPHPSRPSKPATAAAPAAAPTRRAPATGAAPPRRRRARCFRQGADAMPRPLKRSTGCGRRWRLRSRRWPPPSRGATLGWRGRSRGWWMTWRRRGCLIDRWRAFIMDGLVVVRRREGVVQGGRRNVEMLPRIQLCASTEIEAEVLEWASAAFWLAVSSSNAVAQSFRIQQTRAQSRQSTSIKSSSSCLSHMLLLTLPPAVRQPRRTCMLCWGSAKAPLSMRLVVRPSVGRSGGGLGTEGGEARCCCLGRGFRRM